MYGRVLSFPTNPSPAAGLEQAQGTGEGAAALLGLSLVPSTHVAGHNPMGSDGLFWSLQHQAHMTHTYHLKKKKNP